MSNQLRCDLLVIGAGLAGLSAAAWAAQRGARVVVIEKARDIGGSALLSAGLVWTVPSTRKLRYVDDGDRALGAVVVETFAEAIFWLRSRSIPMSGPLAVLYGRGYQIDMARYLRSCVETVEQAGGEVQTATITERLLSDASGRVVGARIVHGTHPTSVFATNTIIATGGFQASADLRAKRIHANARNMPLRSNPHSTGDGVLLGLAAGACLTPDNPGFYGHLHCYPAALNDLSKCGSLTQYHSEHSVLLNRQGQRFCDESLVDHMSAQETLKQTDSLALLVWDQRIQDEYVMQPRIDGFPPLDKLAFALAEGAQGALCPTLEDVARNANIWGFDGAAVHTTLQRYSATVRHAPETLSPDRTGALLPNDKPPYRILVVQPAITFTHAGLVADAQARVLDHQGHPIPGLLVAGADLGNIYKRGYAGGLAAALAFGLRAARTAMAAQPAVSSSGSDAHA